MITEQAERDLTLNLAQDASSQQEQEEPSRPDHSLRHTQENDILHTGRVHSLETFGTVDGPGIRFVLFLQGCALRCQFCHNPDSWDTATGKVHTVDEIIEQIAPYISYYRRSGGGLTVTGGEPTLQAPFVASLFREIKRRYGLHTTLDSSGFCEPSKAESSGLLDATDLVLLDLKLINQAKHQALTTQSNERILRFARYLSDRGQSMWIRHVLVPGVTDSEEDLLELGRYIGTLNGVEKLEILPYHRMGVFKWEELGIPYELENVPTPTDEEVQRAYDIIARGRAESVN